MNIPVEIVCAVLALVVGLLANQNRLQQKSIDLLFSKHDELWQRVDAHKLYIAENHYQKRELDAKFDRIEGFLRNGFDALSTKIDHMQQQQRL